ncbi:phosphoribosylglycinamide formyltransferase [Aquamicrobium zhengzhouense]|uniref:Phosphoribosylglycinamide formyltransferase n=1 Tax=Aquamicrobium zhengzhouense TaxID=2781738 RepID=A0ABS0SAN6_9HYPH|nr:phosphoribosylglycinamide formyltransferase [Aquamicrobium zhengzhouense]MBI1620296.1 phosphoribosylglycinamide formyltransferase [Aquamicrobium zhengzhouense]
MSRQKKRVAVLISGRGSNMLALIDAAGDPNFPAEIVGVISDNPDAMGLTTAASQGISTASFSRSSYASKEAHDAAIDAELTRLKADIVCLAGYMRLLTPDFASKWAGKIINIHPSLLPLFKGLDTHNRAIESGMRVHGCSVHFVTPELDDGPVIAQAVVPILPGDDSDTLAARVLTVEHKLYPLAVRMLATGKVRMQGDKAILSGVTAEGALMSPGAAPDAIDIESLARMTP